MAWAGVRPDACVCAFTTRCAAVVRPHAAHVHATRPAAPPRTSHDEPTPLCVGRGLTNLDRNRCMRNAYSWGMESSLEAVIREWHACVNDGDLQRAAKAVGDPIVVLGPNGVGAITPAQFSEWVERSGIKLIPRSWRPISERLMVVEQDATWPESTAPTRVATVFRASGGKVTAALRLPDLAAALSLATICREMAASE